MLAAPFDADVVAAGSAEPVAATVAGSSIWGLHARVEATGQEAGTHAYPGGGARGFASERV